MAEEMDTTNNSSYVEWGAVWGGSAIAIAISAVLLQFGSGIGFSAGSDAVLESGSASWTPFVGGLWVVLVALASSAAGGYFAGRMRTRVVGSSDSESEFRDGTHGFIVWAVATAIALAGAALLTTVSSIGGAMAAAVAASDAGAAEQAADVARITANASLIFNFSSAAGAALGAAAAWFAAQGGGKHRDEGTDYEQFFPAFARRKA